MALVTKSFSDIITFTRASTGTFFNSAGTLTTAAINAPRFDYNPSTLAAQGLLIEEQRTNLATYSREFDNASGWTNTNTSVTANAIIALDGTLTGDLLIPDTNNTTHFLTSAAISFTSGTTYTYSVYAKASGYAFLRLAFAPTPFGASTRGASFNIAVGTVGQTQSGVTASISPAGNGWYRCSISAAATTTSTDPVFINSQNADSATSVTFAGNGTSGAYLWGAQLEAGAFPTSYIPTTTTALTRSADVASVNTLSPLYNSTEGTLYIEGVTNSTANGFATLDDGSAADYMRFGRGFNKANFVISIAAGSQADIYSIADLTVGAQFKFAGAYKTNDAALALNGATPVTDTSVTLPPSANRLRLGLGLYSGYINGYLRRITYYPRRLSNAELQAITTP